MILMSELFRFLLKFQRPLSGPAGSVNMHRLMGVGEVQASNTLTGMSGFVSSGKHSSRQKYLLIEHGKLTIQVPLDIFRVNTAVMDDKKAEEFRKMLSARYPWLSRYALDIILENARRQMESIIEKSKPVQRRARELMDRGLYFQALHLLESYLDKNPHSGESWELRGEILVKMGRKEEGYSSFFRARRCP